MKEQKDECVRQDEEALLEVNEEDDTEESGREGEAR